MVMQMEVPFAEVCALGERARQSGISTLVNLAPVPPDFTVEQAGLLMQITDILVLNEHEIGALSAALGLDRNFSPEAAAAAIASRFDLTLIATPSVPDAQGDGFNDCTYAATCPAP